MKVSVKDFKVETVADPYPEHGELHPPPSSEGSVPDAEFVGVLASVELVLPMPRRDRQGTRHSITHTVKSPGLWGIGVDATAYTAEYLAEVGEEEKTTLADMLRAMGIEVMD